jgi:hypothetical protein
MRQSIKWGRILGALDFMVKLYYRLHRIEDFVDLRVNTLGGSFKG